MSFLSGVSNLACITVSPKTQRLWNGFNLDVPFNGQSCCTLLKASVFFPNLQFESRLSSITTYSVYSQRETHNLRKSLKSPSLHKPLYHPRLPFQLTKLHVSSSSSHCLTHFYLSSNFTTQTSKLSTLDYSQSFKKTFSKFLSEKIVLFLIGSFIFMGCFRNGVAIAMPAHTSSSNANMEEKRDTQEGKSEEEDMYEKVLEKEPRNVEALKVVLFGKMRRGETKEALKCVERLVDEEPDEVEWRLLKALCYETMGKLRKAKRLYKEILKERPLLLTALHGLTLLMHKNYEGPAIFEMLNNALEIAQREKRVTDERNLKFLIAQMHAIKGELDEGLKKFQDLVKEDPRDMWPYLNLGIIYTLQDKKKESC